MNTFEITYKYYNAGARVGTQTRKFWTESNEFIVTSDNRLIVVEKDTNIPVFIVSDGEWITVEVL